MIILLNYDIYGQGQPLLFLHGFLEDSSIWSEVWPEFKKKGFKVITVDLPCHGESRFTGDKCEMTYMAEQVYNILQIFKVEKPIIVGHSLGGYVGLELLKLIDSKLILLHSNFWEDPPEKKRDRDRVINIVRSGTELFIREAIPGLFAEGNRTKCQPDIDRLIRDALRIPAEEVAAATAGMRDRKAHYKTMESGNVSLIHGENDPIIPTDVLEKELKKLKHAPAVVTLSNCGHMSIWENRDGLIKAIEQLV
ncbi:MAG: alpha/beta hydrolase [Crocinitomicaceae bacterium]|nr:alpha/beta hydrolase [Crocinitomicaceae bacterium]